MFTILLGIGMIGVGILMLKYHQQVYNFTGSLDFVDRWVTAGTPAFLRIFAVALVIIGLGMVFGVWGWLTQPISDGFRDAFGGGIK